MMKKEYMTPELETIELEFEGTLMEISTPEGEYDASEIEDI